MIKMPEALPKLSLDVISEDQSYDPLEQVRMFETNVWDWVLGAVTG